MTLKEIAAEIGVSPSIVSRVLNGYGGKFTISEELRQRILETVSRRGYVPNPVFRAIRTRRTRQVAMIYNDLSIFFTGRELADMITAVRDVVEGGGCQFFQLFLPQNRNNFYVPPYWQTAGVILPSIVHADRLTLIEERDLPYVVLNGVAGPKGSAVQSDEAANMRLAMEALHGLGHRRIAYFNFPPCQRHYSMTDRHNGYLAECVRLGIPVLEGHAANRKPAALQFREALRQGATAAVTYDHDIAATLLHEAWKIRLRIPEEFSVLTFNDAPLLDRMIPPLSAIDLPSRAMGKLAAERLLARLNGDQSNAGEIRKLPGRLIRRESLAPPPSEIKIHSRCK